MLKLLLPALLLFLTALMGMADGETSTSKYGNLVVQVIDLASDDGTVKIALSNSEENYYAYDTPYLGVTAPINEGRASWKFRDLPLGDYAVKVFHDEDGDDELDTNILGMPTEDYGFSNDARGMFGPPSYDDARFTLDSASLTIVVRVD